MRGISPLPTCALLPFAAQALQKKSSVGAGLRLVTPILERSGLRFDVAVPLDAHGADLDGVMTQLTFGQAFGVPDVTPLKPRRLK